MEFDNKIDSTTFWHIEKITSVILNMTELQWDCHSHDISAKMTALFPAINHIMPDYVGIYGKWQEKFVLNIFFALHIYSKKKYILILFLKKCRYCRHCRRDTGFT